MPIFSLNQTAALRPDWWPIHASDYLVFEAGQELGPVRHDAPAMYAVLEGEVVYTSVAESATLTPGEAVAIPAGTAFKLQIPSAHSVILRLEGEPGPPFRLGATDADEAATSPIQLQPAKRRGALIYFDESATFSPHLIAAALNGDLGLQMNLGAVSRGQVKEVRRQCDEASRAVATVVIRTEDDEDPVQLFLDRHRWEMVRELRPLHIGIEADLGSDAGRLRAETFRRGWQSRLYQNGLQFMVLMNWRAMSDQEMLALFEYLSHVPPAHLALAVKLRGTGLSIRDRQILRALGPWLRLVATAESDGYHELCTYLDGAGFQGWVLRTI